MREFLHFTINTRMLMVMKKLVLVALLLGVVLLLSWWARVANFSVFTMMQNVVHPKVATSSALPVQTTHLGDLTPTPIPVEILITVTPNGFVPDVIMISPNTKITWVNKSGAIANITSDPQNTYTSLNLGDFGQNASLSLLFPTAG